MPKKTSVECDTSLDSLRSEQVTVPVPGRFSYDGLHRTFHEKARLGIMTSLLSYPNGLSFNDLKELCSLSDGNLNRHIDVLKEEKYVEVEKTGAGRTAKTNCTATKLGKSQFLEYITELQKVVADAAIKSQAGGTTLSPSRRYGTT